MSYHLGVSLFGLWMFACLFFFFFFKQKTAYEMRISDWSSDVCSSDLSDGPWQTRARECPLAGPGPYSAATPQAGRSAAAAGATSAATLLAADARDRKSVV